jgi:hypothetical protein
MAQAPTSSPDQGSIQIPDEAVIQCPIAAFNLVPVANCIACPKCGGLEDRFPGSDQMDPTKRYTVRCFGEPMKRSMLLLVKG